MSMSTVFPLVRAGDVVPFVKWMRDSGQSVERVLDGAGLSGLALEDRERPVPLTRAIALMEHAGRDHGADIGCRVVGPSSIADLGPLGEALLAAGTPRAAFDLFAAEMPGHSTHELITAVPAAGGVVVLHNFRLPTDALTLHVIQQYVAALLHSLCAMAWRSYKPLGRVDLTPHPTLGVDHLRQHLGGEVHASASRTLRVFIPDAALDRPFRQHSAPMQRPLRPEKLRGDDSFAWTARVALEGMLDTGLPSLAEFAEAGWMSRGTLQRRLQAEGTSFAALLDDVRRRRALAALADGDRRITDVAVEVGYSRLSVFTRAVRRWSTLSPREVRKRSSA